jgi:hypothetical protein
VRRPTRIGVVAAAAFGYFALLSLSARGDEIADGRRHAQRASHLAAQGKCRQAIAEYDKAIPVIRDPALLFNRGECHRRLGNVDAALRDYDQFLNALPSAPNRLEVESHITELKKQSSVTASQAAGSGAASPVVRVEPDVSPAPRTRSADHPATAAGSPAASSLTQPPRPAEGTAPTSGAAAASTGNASVRVTTPAERGPSSVPILDHESPPSVPVDSHNSFVQRPWFWLAVGAVAVGVGTFLILGRHDTTIPNSDLGNYKF